MRVAIFGGTGAIGGKLLDLLLADGAQVSAFARNPDKLTAAERLRVLPGSLHDADVVSETVRGADAVLSVLGPGSKADEMPSLIDGYRNIVAAMDEHGVRRLVALGTPSITDPADGREWRTSLMVRGIRTFQPFAYNAIVEIATIIRSSDLQWTIVRVPLLTNSAGGRGISVRAVGGRGRAFLCRANAAAYFHGQLTATDQFGRAPLISDR